MRRLKILGATILLLAGAFSAQARVMGNGPEQSGATNARVLGIFSIDMPGR